MPSSGTRPSVSRTTSVSSTSGAGSPGPFESSTPSWRGELVRVADVRVDRHGGARGGEASDDRALGAVVDDRHADPPTLGGDVGRRRRDVRDERGALHRRLGQHLLERLVDAERALVGDGDRAHGAALAEPQRERARVDLVERDDAALGEPERPLLAAEPPHQHGAGVRRRDSSRLSSTP